MDGGCKGNKPIDWATDEMYEKEIEKYIDQGLNSLEFIAKCRTAKRNFKRRKNLDDKYIKTYHIDSKEGLLIFLIEMKNYYLRKNKLPETEVKKYDELIAKVSFIVLEKINPAISAYDWMQGGVKNRNIYNAALERDKKSEIGKMFRNALLNFDKAVNSFLNDSIEFDDMENYLNKLKITGDVYDYSDGEYREGCCYLKISNPEICSTTYYRNLNGFTFKLMYKLGDNQYFNVLHYFSQTGNFESDKGKVIAIDYSGSNTISKIDIRYNITNGKAGENYKEKTTATQEQISFVYNELLRATKYASSITIENMKKKTNNKQLALNKGGNKL